MRNRVLPAAAVAGSLLLISACGTSTAPGSAYGGGTARASTSTRPSAASSPTTTSSSGSGRSRAVLTVRKTAIGYVLANAEGYTIYWFARDPKGSPRSACTGGCLLEWFPVTGRPVAAKGVTLGAALGTITRASGLVQATYNGYPLYTFGSDSAPGQTNGNGSGGAWHVIKEGTSAKSAAGGSW